MLSFLEENKAKIIGNRLQYFHAEMWPVQQRISEISKPVILEFPDYCLVLDYLILSDIEITVGTKEEIEKISEFEFVFQSRDFSIDYYSEGPYQNGVKKELIENCTVLDIQIERFSNEFECDIGGTTRPEGGDYFSTIRFILDSGTTLCFCSEDGFCDRYLDYWCE